MDNIDNKFIEKGYVPFDLNLINKNTTSDCVLILDDGSFFLGRSFGSKKKCFGEICFNTSFSGYQEIITDPSYTGQIINLGFSIRFKSTSKLNNLLLFFKSFNFIRAFGFIKPFELI